VYVARVCDDAEKAYSYIEMFSTLFVVRLLSESLLQLNMFAVGHHAAVIHYSHVTATSRVLPFYRISSK